MVQHPAGGFEQTGGAAALALVLGDGSCDAELIDAQDSSGTTALMLAAKNGHVSVLDALVAAGAAPYAVDAKGREDTGPRPSTSRRR